MTTPQPRDLLADDLQNAVAILRDRGDALSNEDARDLATILMFGDEGGTPASRARLMSAYMPGVVTNLAFVLPEDVTIRNLATVLGCDLIRARNLMAGGAVLRDDDLERLEVAYDIRPGELAIQFANMTD